MTGPRGITVESFRDTQLNDQIASHLEGLSALRGELYQLRVALNDISKGVYLIANELWYIRIAK